MTAKRSEIEGRGLARMARRNGSQGLRQTLLGLLGAALVAVACDSGVVDDRTSRPAAPIEEDPAEQSEGEAPVTEDAPVEHMEQFEDEPPSLPQDAAPDRNGSADEPLVAEEPPTVDEPPVTGQIAPGTFTGEIVVALEQHDRCGDGSDEYAGVRTYQHPATVTVDVPMDDGVATETNPFNLQITGGPPDAEGTLGLSSALVLTTPDTGRPLLVQYWEFDHVEGGVTGRLVETGSDLAAQANLIFGTGPLIPCRPGQPEMPALAGIGTDASLEGTMDDTSMYLEIWGSAPGGTHGFSPDFFAQLEVHRSN